MTLVSVAAAAWYYSVPVGTVYYWASTDKWPKHGTRRARTYDLGDVQASYNRRRIPQASLDALTCGQASFTQMEQSRSGLLSGGEATVSAAWTADLPVTAVDNAAGTFTASTADPNVIVMAAATRAKALSVTVTMDDGIAVPVIVGDVLRFASRVAT